MRLKSVRMANAICKNFVSWSWFEFITFSAWQLMLIPVRSGLKTCPSMVFVSLLHFGEAALLLYIHPLRELYFVLEQPTSSKMFNTEDFQMLTRLLGLSMVTTWLGLYGHILPKGTKLLTNLPGAKKLLGKTASVDEG